MNYPHDIAGLVIAGILVSLGFAGVLTAKTSVDRFRQQALLAASLALALSIAERMHHRSELDLWGWVIIVTALIPLWPRARKGLVSKP